MLVTASDQAGGMIAALFDSVGELDALDHLWQLVLTIKFAP